MKFIDNMGNSVYPVVDYTGLDLVSDRKYGGSVWLSEYVIDGKTYLIKPCRKVTGAMNEVICSRIGNFCGLDVVENLLAKDINKNSDSYTFIASKLIDGDITDFDTYYEGKFEKGKSRHREGVQRTTIASFEPSLLKEVCPAAFSGWSTVIVRDTLFLNTDSVPYRENTPVFDKGHKREGEFAPAFDFEYCFGDGTLPCSLPEYAFDELLKKNIEFIPQELVDKVATLDDAKVVEFTSFNGCEDFFGKSKEELETIQAGKIEKLCKQRDLILNEKTKFNARGV